MLPSSPEQYKEEAPSLMVGRLFNAIVDAGPDALRCLFTRALPDREHLLMNMASGWPDADEAIRKATLDALVDAGHILTSIGNRGCYRLKLDVNDTAERVSQAQKPNSLLALAQPHFSCFRGGILTTMPNATITPGQLFTELTSDRHRARTAALRAVPHGSSEHKALKRGFDYVIPAGVFARRGNAELLAPSGLLVLDFDHVPDLAAARAALLSDPHVSSDLVLLFTSPSGDGLKVLARTDKSVLHKESFKAYSDYLGRTYSRLGLAPDEAGKDVARACFVPHASDAWLAPAYRDAFQAMG